jgi:hypothetical protein
MNSLVPTKELSGHATKTNASSSGKLASLASLGLPTKRV